MEEFIEIVKNYGAVVLGFISTLGVAGVGAIVLKAKQVIEKVKESTSKVEKQKEESESALKERYAELQTTIQDQNKKLDVLTEEISRVKGNRKN